MARTGRMPRKGIVWQALAERAYVEQDEPAPFDRRENGLVEWVMCLLGLPIPDDEEASELRQNLGLIVGQWEPPSNLAEGKRATKGTVASKIAQIQRDPRKGKSVYAVSVGPGLHDDVTIQAACALARAVAEQNKLTDGNGLPDVGEGHRLLATHQEKTPGLDAAATKALVEVRSLESTRGRPAHDWHDSFLIFLITLASKNRVIPKFKYDHFKCRPCGSIYRYADLFELLLPPAMRAPSPIARAKRLERSAQRIGWSGRS